MHAHKIQIFIVDDAGPLHCTMRQCRNRSLDTYVGLVITVCHLHTHWDSKQSATAPTTDNTKRRNDIDHAGQIIANKKTTTR